MFFANLEPISKLPVLHDKCKTSFYEEQKFVKEPKKFCVYLHIMQYLYSELEDKKMCDLWKLFNSKGKVRSLRHILRYLHSLDILFR